MKIRSVTCFLQVEDLAEAENQVRAAGRLAREAQSALEGSGLPVQTLRLATQPLSLLPGDLLCLARILQPLAEDAGFAYLSLGPVLADRPEADLRPLERLAELIATHESIFVGALVARAGSGIHLGAIRRLATAVLEIGHSTDLGFGNLRLAMLANVGAHTPFFPAAYHDGGPPAVAVATESADLAVHAFSEAKSLDEARDRLASSVESTAQGIARKMQLLARSHEHRFVGIDFSLAPFPEEARSIGTAVERLANARFGCSGTLFVASLLTACLQQAVFPRCGFCGLMLPVLEDATLAARSREGLFGVNDLLLYSAVCGTGLDTVPLPGSVDEEELASILLDVAALAIRLDKPLTARLMPIPGAKPGDATRFDFDYFANGRVLDVKGLGSPGLFARAEWLDMPLL
jgi:uncharacterized protein